MTTATLPTCGAPLIGSGPTSEPNHAQLATIERLAYQHASVAVRPLPRNRFKLTVFDQVEQPKDGNPMSGKRAVESWLLDEDGGLG